MSDAGSTDPVGTVTNMMLAPFQQLILLSQSCHADLGAARILFCGYSYLHDAAHHHGEQFERRLVFEDVCKQQLFFQIA